MDYEKIAALKARIADGEGTVADLTQMSNIYLATNDLSSAYPYLEQLADQTPEAAQARVTAGLVALTLNREEEAEKHFRQAVDCDPKDFDAGHNLGLLLLLKGEFDEALTIFEQLKSQHPDKAEVYNDLAVIWARKGEHERVLECYEQAITVDPAFQPARANAASYVTENNLISDNNSQSPRWQRLLEPEPTPSSNRIERVLPTVDADLTGRKIAFFAGHQEFVRDIIARLERDNLVQVFGSGTAQQMDEMLQWADLAWFEWCDRFAIEGTRLPKHCPIVVRLHSYEAFTDMPSQVDWTKVDHLLFVNDSVRSLFAQQVRQAPPSTVIHNGVDLSRFTIPKVKPHGKKIASVGYINYKKNPALLLYCFKKIHEYDPDYTLHIAGKHQDSRLKVYFDHFLSRYPLPIHFDGWVDDMPAWYRDKDYVISTSLFESFHYSIAEGMASGVIPLIHDWYGADRLYPDKYLFGDPDDCLRLLKLMEQVDRDPVARENREYIARRYDQAEKNLEIERLLATVFNRSAKPVATT